MNLLIFFVLIFIKSGDNYPTGAPPEACATMMPQHGVASQACISKYTIRSDKTQYYTNDTVRITVSGSTGSDTFRGVLLIAKTQTSGQIIGTWVPMNSTIQTLACGGTANTAITHNSPDDKLSVQALWYPPSTISDTTTIIRATVVTVETQIYVGCFSVTLTARKSNQTTNGTRTTSATNNTSTTTPLTSVVVTTVPQTSTVGVNINWTYANGATAVKMQVNNLGTSQWLALGLSLDQSMGEDHVFVCQRLADDTVLVARLVNPGGHSPPVSVSTISNPGGTFTPTLQKLENGAVYCEFTLSNFANTKRRRRAIASLSQSATYYPLIAMGNLDSSNSMLQHTSRTALSKTVQLNKDETITYNVDSTDSSQIGLVKAHGIIMIFTWILFVSTGILVAFYFKPSWPNRKVCGQKIWFAIHRTLMIIVAVLTIIAFILILVYNKGTWVSQSDQPEFAHSIVGIVVICLTVIQPIMALFRCKPENKNRFIFNYTHGFVGFTALILSIVAIFLAMRFTEFNFQVNNPWGFVVAWICWLPIIFLIFWFIEYYFGRSVLDEQTNNSYDLNRQNENTAEENVPIQIPNNTTKDRIKGIFLLIHIIVAFALALGLAIVIGKL